jgi:GTP-binding GTPase N-terminal
MTASVSGRKIILAALLSAKVNDPEVVLAGYADKLVSKGGIIVGRVLQRRGVSKSKRPGGARRLKAPLNAATYFGTGKVREIAELRRATSAELVVVCASLSPSQLSKLEHGFGCSVLDEAALS